MRAISWWYTLLRLTIDDRQRISHLPRALSTRAKNSWQYSFNKNTQIHGADGKGHPCLAANSPAAPSPNHPQKRATSWRRSRAPHRRSTANSKRSRIYHSFKQRLTLQTGPVWTRKHESEGKGRLRPQQTLLQRRRQPLHRKKSLAHHKSEVWKELAHTQNAVRRFLHVQTASTLEKKAANTKSLN